MRKLITMVFPNLPTDVVVVNKQRTEYYFESRYNSIPKSIKEKIGFYYEFRDGVLWDIHTNEKVIANITQAGKPKVVSIKTNELHAALYKKYASAPIKMKEELRNYFLNMLYRKPKYKITSFPIIIEMKFYMDLKKHKRDADGISQFYEKAFLDSIKEKVYIGNVMSGKDLKPSDKVIINSHGMIPDDNTDYVLGVNHRSFHTTKDPYCVVNIYCYESEEEKQADYDNKLKLQSPQSINGKLATLADRLTTSQLKAKYKEGIYSNGEIKKELMEDYVVTYEYYFDLVSKTIIG